MRVQFLLALVIIAICASTIESRWYRWGRYGGWGFGRGWGGWGMRRWGGWGGGYGGWGRGYGWGGWGRGYGGWGGYGGGLGMYSPWYTRYHYYPSYYGWRYYRDAQVGTGVEPAQPQPQPQPEIEPTHAQCRFLNATSVLSCATHQGQVECGVTSHFPGMGTQYQFEYFGIGNGSTTHGADVDAYYQLYPRKIDNTIWYNHTIKINGQMVHFGIYHSTVYQHYGWRITDQTCFVNLVSLFNGVQSHQVIQVKNSVDVPVNSTVFGEALTVYGVPG